MEVDSVNAAATPNHALQPLARLIGEWKTTGTHPLLPETTLHGLSSFQWLEGGAFLIWRSQMEHKDIPSGIAVFGSDDATGQFYMLYFDERNVSRKYDVSIHNGILKWWREAPGFSQRYTWTFLDGDNGKCDSIIGKGELCQDGTNWKADLDVRLERIS